MCDVTHFDEEKSRSRLYNVASILLQPLTHLLDACNIHIRAEINILILAPCVRVRVCVCVCVCECVYVCVCVCECMCV